MTNSPNPYGHTHQAERERWRPTVEAGQATCTELICLKPTRHINPNEPWDLAHDRRTGGYLGPAHEQCNRSEGGKERHRRTNTRRRWNL